MTDSFFFVCLLLIASLAGIGWWALKIDAERHALSRQLASVFRKQGDLKAITERARAVYQEVKRLEADARQMAVQRARASQEFNAYARDLAMRRADAERDFREQCEADARALEAFKAKLAQQRLDLEREAFSAAPAAWGLAPKAQTMAANNDWGAEAEAQASTANDWQAATDIDFADLRRDEQGAVAPVRASQRPVALAKSGAYLVSKPAAAS